MSPRARVRRAIDFVLPHRRAVVAILALTVLVGALNAAEPLMMKAVFDALGDTLGQRRFVSGAGWLVAIGVSRELVNAVSNWLTWRTRIRVHYRLLDATVSQLHRLPLTFHRSQGVGATMTRLDRGIQGFVGALNDLAFQILPAIVYLAVSLVVMVRLEWRLALLLCALVPLPALITTLAAPVQTRRERTLLDRWARIYSRFNEVLSGIVTVKSFAMEEREKRRFLDDVNHANDTVIRGVGFDSSVTAGQNLVVTLARVSALVLGGWLVWRGQMTAGTLVAFLGYVTGLFGPVQGLTSVYRTVHAASVAVDTIFSILDAPDQLSDAPDAREVGHLRGDVSFEGVRFSHEDAGSPVLRHIDLEVRAGEMVAIVGPSGSGKSTLMALLQRFYDPDAGIVRVDGLDVRGLKQQSLRRNIGVVLQDALLFNETVRDNIAYGRPQASEAEVMAAAEAANVDPFVRALPEGYDTLVGERGCRLSAGERQRIAIARALLKDPPILILDEATSALDAETEAQVQEAVERLVRGRTTLLIAHRLSTVVRAHRIIVLRDGRIVECGSHGELVRRDGYYAGLVRRQTDGLIAA